MFNFTQSVDSGSLLASRLYSQDDFYLAFVNDLKKAKQQVIIESPFITTKRMNILLPILSQLAKCGVRVIVNTKPIDEHESGYQLQAQEAIGQMQELGILVLMTAGHHRKLAVIDKQVLWEGSLNILSQNDSCEVMRRIYSVQLENQMLAFLHLEKFIG